MTARVELVATLAASVRSERGAERDRQARSVESASVDEHSEPGSVSARGAERGGQAERGEDHETETNTWIVGDDAEVVVIDAGHDAPRIMSAVGDREVLAVICTHGLRGHVDAAVEVADRDEAPIALHAGDRVLWDLVHPGRRPDIEVEDGGMFEAAGERLDVLHTPGHTHGGVSLYAAGLEVVFSGDTLGKSGPGAAQSPYSDFPTLLTSIGEQLLTLPGHTRVCPAQGEETTIEEQDSEFDKWVSKGEPGGEAETSGYSRAPGRYAEESGSAGPDDGRP